MPAEIAGLVKDLVASLDRRTDQILRLEGVLFGLERMVDLIAKRDSEAELGPVTLDMVLEDEIEFWKADLFFKHKVETSLDAGPHPISIVTSERLLKDLIDIFMTMCIDQVRDAEDKKIRIGIEKDGLLIRLGFSHTRRPFSADLDGMEDVSCGRGVLLDHFTVPIFDLARAIAGKLNAAIEVSPQMIKLVFTVK